MTCLAYDRNVGSATCFNAVATAAIVCFAFRILLQTSAKETDVIMGTALASGENSLVDALLEILGVLCIFPEEDQTSTGTTESLVTSNNSAVKFTT